MNSPTNVQQLPAGERQGVILWAGQHFGVDAGKVLTTMKSTCFRGDGKTEVTDAEVAALLIVAREHGLNPFLKEIYAFPAKGGGIVPIVGFDGWVSIVNKHPQYNGVEFIYEGSDKPAWIECHMYRKDRGHPIKVRELMSECKRSTGPWDSHPSRMLRHKAYIQCARVAFGFAGIYDPDEGEAIVEGRVIDQPTTAEQPQRGAAGLAKALEKAKPAGTVEERDKVVVQMEACTDLEVLHLARDGANLYEWTPADQVVIDEAYHDRKKVLEAA